ncbi:MAG: ABC-F family ATP-binding cassette domain-containing protein, partial [Rhodobiaceae bacterium]|nr:ABC-F family ATP-binding cassette domain-containing protein [Rhodobiaceae bacterium]
WRMRVALAAVLFSEPDLLLLDEPTNYLDLEGVIWLESYLARYPHTVIIISHDRDLLNVAVNTIVHLDRGKLNAYRGGYDQFERKRREKQALDLKLKKKQDDARRHMEAFVERFRYKASKARQAQSRIKMLERMEPIVALIDDQVRPFHLPNPTKRLAPPIIAMEDASVGYAPGKPVLRGLDIRIDDDDRIGLLGANGNGKSTLAKLISARLSNESGRVKRAHKMDIAYFAQHQLDELHPKASAYEHIRALMPDATEAQVRSRTAQLGFGADKAETPAEKLSGGEKARLQLGIATFHGPHLLILDEPTNHLDADSRDALVEALNDYEGAVILISHDRRLIERTVDRLLLVHGGTVEPYDGDMDDYRRFLLDARKAGDDPSAKADDTASVSAAERRRETARRRQELDPIRKEVKALEKEMEALISQIRKFDALLADPTLFASDPERGADVSRDRARTADRLEEAELRWIELSETVEKALAEIAGEA